MSRLGRYLVVSNECLECSIDGDSNPEVVASFESEGDALQHLREMGLAHDGSRDAFVLDTLRGATLSAYALYERDRAGYER